jgi:hypothetical protein
MPAIQPATDLEAAFHRAIAPGPCEHLPPVIVCHDDAELADVMQRLRPANLMTIAEITAEMQADDAEVSVSRLMNQVMDLMRENRALRTELAALKAAN